MSKAKQTKFDASALQEALKNLSEAVNAQQDVLDEFRQIVKEQLRAGLLSEEALLHVMKDTARRKNMDSVAEQIHTVIEETQHAQETLEEISADFPSVDQEIQRLTNIFSLFMKHVKQRNLLAQQINKVENEENSPPLSSSPPQSTRCILS